MNLDKTTAILKKINRLYEIISDIGDASITERDLLKAYITELYESISEGTVPVNKAIPTAAPKIVAAPVGAVVSAPAPAAKEKVEAKSTKVTAKSTPKVTHKVTNEMDSLFDIESGSELSDKLSSAPIKDLNKAMGLNEKIFTQQELFGGDGKEMAAVLAKINGLSDFEQAKTVLIEEVARKYEWDTPAKEKKARTFIKLVQRRFK